MSRAPREYENLPLVLPEGAAFRVDGREWRTNPLRSIPAVAHHVRRLWERQRGGMAPGPLPEAGGVNDQPAWLMAAFVGLDIADHEWTEKQGKEGG